MPKLTWSIFTMAVAGVLAASIAALWSWNTLAELFGGPDADFRHVFAALIIALLARGLFLTPRARRNLSRRNRRTANRHAS